MARRALAAVLRLYVRVPWFPYRYTITHRLFDPARGDQFEFDVSFFGMPYYGNINNNIDWSVYFFGAYALEELTLLQDLARLLRSRSNDTVVFCDIGANVGIHTLFMAKHADQVHSFEPYPKVRCVLEQRVRANRLDNVTIHPIALGVEDGDAAFHEPEDTNLGQGTLVAPTEHVANSTMKVAVRAGDSYFQDPAFGNVSLIKIDVEGYEPLVLEGLRRTLRRYRPPVLMELLDETRRAVTDERGLRRLFYDDCEFYSVAQRRDRTYALKPFSFVGAREILAVPKELRIESSLVNGKLAIR